MQSSLLISTWAAGLFLCMALLGSSACSDTALAETGTEAGSLRQFGNVVYRIPDGWMKGRTDADSVVLLADDERYTGYIYVHRGAEKPMDAAAWLKQRMLGALEEDEREGELSWVTPETTEEGNKRMTLAAVRVGSRMHTGAALEIGRRIEFFRYEASLPDDDQEAAVLAATVPLFVELCLKSEFISEGRAPLLGSPKAGDLQGVFMGQVLRMGVDLNMNYVARFYVFTKAGRFSEALPVGVAVADYDPSSQLDSHPHEVGNYRVSGSRLRLKYADGGSERFRIKEGADAASIELDGVTYVLLEAPKDGTRFEGYYQSLFYSGFTPGSGISGGVTSERGYTFKKNGTFEANRFAGAFGSFDDGGGFSTGSDEGQWQGRYEVKGGLLLLTSQDGKRTGKLSIVSTGEEHGLLYLDGEQFLNRSKKD